MRTRRRPPKGLFGSEAELCRALIDRVRDEFAVYPETSGWDLVLVSRATGEQIGIEAKLRANLDVLVQAHAYASHELRVAGPAVRAVLVPDAGHAFKYIARELRLAVIEGWMYVVDREGRQTHPAAAKAVFDVEIRTAPRWSPKKPLWLPPAEPAGLVAGASAPLRMTPWKVKALELCALLRSRGYLEPADFRRLKVDSGWWIRGIGRTPPRLIPESRGRYVQAPGMLLPDEMWPELAVSMRVGEAPTKAIET